MHMSGQKNGRPKFVPCQLSKPMQTHRGIVVAGRAGVAASQPLAVSAALQILARGGSCVDAAITASAVISVV